MSKKDEKIKSVKPLIEKKKTIVKKTITKENTIKLKDKLKKTSKIVGINKSKVKFIGKCTQNISFIKSIFGDIFLLFKNFIHWNISKLIIFVWSIILGFISIIPLIIIFFIYTFFSDTNISMLIEGMFNGKLLYNFFGNIILLGIIFVYFIVFSYSNILFIRLNNSYIDREKLEYKKNEYFNFKKIIKFFNLTLLSISILLIPVLIFFVLIGALILLSGNLTEVNALVSTGINNYFTIFSFIFLIICISFLVYLFYKIIFSYFILSDDKYYKEGSSTLGYIKESFTKTKSIKTFIKFITIIGIFLILTAPINYIGKIFENNGKYLNDYSYLLATTEKEKKSILDESSYYEALKIKFYGLDSSDIANKIKQNYIYSILFSIFDFIFLYGLFVMILASFYKRELNLKKQGKY